MVTLLDQTPKFDSYMARLVVKNGCQNTHLLNNGQCCGGGQAIAPPFQKGERSTGT